MRVVPLTVYTEDVPWVRAAQRLEVEELECGFWRVRAVVELGIQMEL